MKKFVFIISVIFLAIIIFLLLSKSSDEVLSPTETSVESIEPVLSIASEAPSVSPSPSVSPEPTEIPWTDPDEEAVIEIEDNQGVGGL